MRARLLLITLFLAFAATPAFAAGGVGVVVTGDATLQPQLTAQLEDWLRQRGYVLEPSPIPADALNTLIDCFVIEDLACAKKVVEDQAKSPSLVFAKVDSSDTTTGMRDVTITSYWFERGMEPIAVRRSCQKCTDEKLRTTASELMAALAGQGRAEIGQVMLTSNPSGARVAIDGREVGVTPMTYALPAGDHEVTLTHATAGTAQRTLHVTTAETTTLEIHLRSSGGRARTLPVGLLAVGGALLVGSVIMFAIDEDDTGENYEYRDAAPFGVAFGVAGLAAVGAGAYLMLRGRPADRGPHVSVLPGGAVVGWGRSF